MGAISSGTTAGSRVALVLCLLLPASAPGGIGPDGFFDRYLVLGPFLNPDGHSAGALRQAADFLCDGTTYEDSISPAEGLVLGLPDPVKCAAENSGYGGSGRPAVVSVSTSGDLLDLYRSVSTAPNLVAYAWVYAENTTADPLVLTLALASDDGVQVEVNRNEVFTITAPLHYNNPGSIHDRFPITLVPGVNLVQFKVFQGGGYWGLRARLEDPTTSNAILDGDARVRIGIVGQVLGGLHATRTIAPDGTRAADISVAVESAGEPYTLEETFGAGWSVASASAGPSIAGQTITWMDAKEANVSYRLVRTRAFSMEESRVAGLISKGEVSLPVGGHQLIPGFARAFVDQVLLTPAFSLAGLNGCDLAPMAMQGPWIGDGGRLTDEDILPREGFEFRPDFGGPGSQASGLFPIRGDKREIFWTNPADPAGSKARLVRVAAGAEGIFNFNSIYATATSACVNVAYFFAVNDTGQDPLPTVIGLGSDDGAAVRLNGVPVWSHPACRPVSGFEDKVPIKLRAGKNLIAVYTFDGGGEYGLTLRFEDGTGTPIALDTTLDPEGYAPPPPPPECAAEIAQTERRWVGVFLEHTVALKGGELGIAYDPAVAAPFAVQPGTDLPPGVQLHVQLRPGNQCPAEAGVAAGLTAAWILPPSSPVLPRGKHEVLRILFAPATGLPLGTCSPLRFVTCLGVAGAPVMNVVTDPGLNSILVVARDGQVCLLEEPPFRRGDANGDGRFDISDPIGILGCLFLGDSCGTCPDGGDVDDNGVLEITDAIRLLEWRFLDGRPPDAPFPGCGLDSTIDKLSDCEVSSCR